MLSNRKVHRLPNEIEVKLGIEKVKDKSSAFELDSLSKKQYFNNNHLFKRSEYAATLQNILEEKSNERKRLVLLGINLILYSIDHDLPYYQKIIDLEVTKTAKESRIITIDKLLMSEVFLAPRNLALFISILQNSKLIGIGLSDVAFNRMEANHFKILGEILAGSRNISLFCLRFSLSAPQRASRFSDRLPLLGSVMQRSHIKSFQLHDMQLELWSASDSQQLKIIWGNVTNLSLTNCRVDKKFYEVLSSLKIVSLSMTGIKYIDEYFGHYDHLNGLFSSIPASLTQLYLFIGISWTDNAIESFNAFLKRVNIKILAISGSSLRYSACWKKFCIGLKNSNVEILNLTDFNAEDNTDIWEPLSDAIVGNQSLKCITGLTGKVAALGPLLQANFANKLTNFNGHHNEEQVTAWAETLSEYQSTGRWGQVLQCAVANFLQAVIARNPWRIDHLLLQVSASSLPAREVYGRYFELTFIDAYDKFQSPSAALLKALKFCFDADNQTVHFTLQMQRQLDVFLQTALGITVAPNELKVLSTKERALLWRWLILQELVKILKLQTSQATNLAKINRTLPLIDNDAALLIELWASMSTSLINGPVRTSKKLQRWLRGLEYASRMINLANAEKSFAEFFQGVNTENAVTSFLQALPLCLNYYHGFISFSDEHDIIFDKYLGKACGIETKKLTDLERLALLRFLILRALNADINKKYSGRFFDSKKDMLLPRINNAIDDKIQADLAALEEDYKKEILFFVQENNVWQPLYNCLDCMRWLHVNDVHEKRLEYTGV